MQIRETIGIILESQRLAVSDIYGKINSHNIPNRQSTVTTCYSNKHRKNKFPTSVQ